MPPMTWTRTPPTEPGRYRCRFLPAPGIDREPFEVELVEDTINGGVVARDEHGLEPRTQTKVIEQAVRRFVARNRSK